MALYSTFQYGDGTKYTGFTKEPLRATVLGTDYVTSVVNGVSVTIPVPAVTVSWGNPTEAANADVNGIRLVRNQNGFSENEEDGKVIFEEFGLQNTVFVDNDSSFPLTAGRYAYYTLWFLYSKATGDLSWKLASFTSVVIPKDHGVVSPTGVKLASSTDKLMRLLPKVYTSGNGDSVGEISQTTDLYNFLSGFAYTQDEIATNTDLLVKTFTGQDVNPNFVSPLAHQLGLPNLPIRNMITQKKLIRQAVYLYKHKGTLASIQEYVSTLTGYPTVVSASPNLLLSSQDSSFYNGVGNWVSSGSAVTLTADNSSGPTTEPYSLSNTYVGKAVTTTTTGSISLGSSSPLLNAIPVTAGDSLSLSFYVKSAASSTGQVFVDFYNYKNVLVYTQSFSSFSATTSWVKKTFSFNVPTVDGSSNSIDPIRAVLRVALTTVTTYYFDLFQLWAQADTRGTQYRPARGVEIYLAPKKVNYLNNPSFSSATSWTVTGFTGTLDYSMVTDVPGIVDGSHILHVPSANPNTFLMTSNSSNVTGGSYYSLSLYAKTSSGSMPATLSISALDSDSSSEIASMTLPEVISITNSWKRYSTRFFVPSYSGNLYLKIAVTGASVSSTPLVDLYFDAAQLEQGYVPTDYFDGDYSIRGATWTGIANNSVSISYPNKQIKLTQLKNTLLPFLPINTPYLITTGYGSVLTLEGSGVSS